MPKRGLSPPKPWEAPQWAQDAVEAERVRGLDHAKKAAAAELIEELVDHYLTGKRFSAKSLCVVSHWAAEAGISECKKYALAPGASTGHYQRKIDAALDLQAIDEHLYTLETPGRSREDLERSPQTVNCVLPHEALYHEIQKRPGILSDWAKELESSEFVDSYNSHPLVRGKTHKEKQSIVPIALYADKAPYTQRDGFLGMSCHLCTTGERHLTFCLRTADLCDCGCSHWCSLHVIFCLMRWSLLALAQGKFPERRHDGGEWRDNDAWRSSMAGKECRSLVLRRDAESSMLLAAAVATHRDCTCTCQDADQQPRKRVDIGPKHKAST